MKRLLIVTSSSEKNPKNFFNYENLMRIKETHDIFVDLKFISDNKVSLARAYNRHLTDPANRESNIVFVHSDVFIADPNFVDKVSDALEKFDIIGVAGCIPPFDLNNSGGLCTWHNLGSPTNRFGRIRTYKQRRYKQTFKYDDETFTTEYGPVNKRSFLIDGCFIGVNVSKVFPGLTFDEMCPSRFHFYDLLFSWKANKIGLKVGVIGLDLVHCSPGLVKFDDEFFAGNRYFGEILHKEGFLPAPPPKKPDLNSTLRVETAEGVVSVKSDFVKPPLLERIPVPMVGYIPPAGSRIYVNHRLKHGGPIGANAPSVPNWIHVPSDKSGCSWWRLCLIDQYGNYSNRANIIDINTTIGDIAFWDRNFDAIRMQREFSNEEVKYYTHLSRLIHERGYKTKMIWEIDDIVIDKYMPDFNQSKGFFIQPHIQDNMKRIVDMCSHVTVVSDYMKYLYEPFFGGKEIRVLENYSHKGWFDGLYDYEKRMRKYEENKDRPRILLAGGGTHFQVGSTSPFEQGDYSHIINTVIKTRKDFKWCFMGHMPAQLEPFVDNGDIEFIKWANLVEYPVRMEEINAQVLLAPLELNDFNLAKSNIKERESYYLGRPCVVQDMEPYKNAFHRFRTGDEAIDQIKSITKDAQTYGDWCKKYRERSNGVWMEDVWDSKIVEAYK